MLYVKRFGFVLGILVISMQYACLPYGSRAFHVPLLNEKGDLQVGASISPLTGLEIQADYAWSHHFYSPVDFSYSYLKSGQTSQQSNAYSVGIGYYTKIKENTRFNCYFTPMYGNYGSANSSFQSNFFAQSLGADIGHRFKHFESAFSLKFETFQLLDNNFRFEGGSPNLTPGLTMRFGGERYKFHMQLGLSYPLTNNDDFVFYTMGMGLTYRINVFNRTH
ncbi:MAG: hypothetical protein R3279_11435 [Putridiphycobacter sp.]|nr:hypothetical protein [Putridiphycobacter sp.]